VGERRVLGGPHGEADVGEQDLAVTAVDREFGGPVFGLAAGLSHAQNNIPLADLKIRAEAGDKTATRQLAEAYYTGNGVEQDFKMAAQWYEKLAKLGDPRAQTSLGLLYARGYGVEKNVDTALKWWKFAALQNDPAAQFNLGTTYLEGNGVAQNYPEAMKWYRNAAMRGHLAAQFNLGMMYFDGKGADKDPRMAYYWLAVAAEQGDDDAKAELKKVAAVMTPAQVREADSQAKDGSINDSLLGSSTDSRSAGVSERFGVTSSPTSASSPSWWLRCPPGSGPPRGREMSST